jgi:hypothetical protein
MLNKRNLIGCLLLWLIFTPLRAQLFEVSNFRQLRNYWPLESKYQTNKTMAYLDFITTEDGFTFLANGREKVEAEKGDEGWTLLVPHRTRWIVIQHEKLGQYTWQVPKKPLKKKKHYQASLRTISTEESYQLDHQWLVFRLSPSNALLWVDSIPHKVRTGEVQMLLPLGSHSYRVESPFYKEVEDTLQLSNSERRVINIDLQPMYAYLSVQSVYPDADIYVDGAWIGRKEAVSPRLTEGTHQVKIMWGAICLYDESVFVAKAEKRELKLTKSELYPRSYKQKPLVTAVLNKDSLGRKIPTTPVELTAPDETYQILVNREVVGNGNWTGSLPEGDYAVQTRKEEMESHVFWLHAVGSEKLLMNLPVPQTAYGALSIHSNVIDAEIWIANKQVGITPFIVEHLPAGKPCRITLRKLGYKEASQTVVPPENNITNVSIKLKKK